MPTITCVEDFRQLYKRRVPKMFYDYAESGPYTETTFHRNEADFKQIKIRQRVGVDISNVDTSAIMAGEAANLPVAFAPVGMRGSRTQAVKSKLPKRPVILGCLSSCPPC
jgi:L-lactate dehydrogenase (cytochrome)